MRFWKTAISAYMAYMTKENGDSKEYGSIQTGMFKSLAVTMVHQD